MKMINEKLGWVLISVVCIVVAVGFVTVAPIAQDAGYHSFSDTDTLIAIPNALNVLSNIPFIFVGVLGLLALRGAPNTSLNIVASNRSAYVILFLGAALVGIGSGYYHLWPSNDTLVWDRIPMTIAFMALYSIIISEFVSEKLGRLCLIPLLLLGIASVLYWWYTESQGVGDLRFYALVQFFPLLTIPLLLLFFRSKYKGVQGYWLLLLTYLAAKLFEEYDLPIHEFIGVVSGHSIKHVLPAIGLYVLINSYRKRDTITIDANG